MRICRAAIAAILIVPLVGGCTAVPQSAGFDSEAAVTAAAMTVVEDYVDAISEVYRSRDLAALEGTISVDLMAAEQRSANPESNLLVGGELGFFDPTVTQLELSGDYPTVFVRVRACLDFRDTTWVNAAGEDVTSRFSPWRPWELALIDDPEDPGRLLIDDVNWWVGYDFCPTPRGRHETPPESVE